MSDDNVVIVQENVTNVVVASGNQGPPGPSGPPGSLPVGGTAGQVLIEATPGTYVWGPINGGTP